MAKTLAGSAYGIEIPPGDVEALRSSAGNLEQLASHIGEELRRATTERTGLSGTWGGLAAANYQKTATDLELGLRTLEAHIHEASGAIHTYASALETSKAGAREAIRIASDAEGIWQELQRWAEGEIAALSHAMAPAIGVAPVAMPFLADIERQLQQGYDIYRSELARARDRAEQEMQAAKHSAHLLAGRLHQGVVKMPWTLPYIGIGVAGLVQVGAQAGAQAAALFGGPVGQAGMQSDSWVATVNKVDEIGMQLGSWVADLAKGANLATKGIQWALDDLGSSDGTLGTVESAVGDFGDTLGKVVPFLSLLAVPHDVQMLVDPGQSGAWGVGDRVAGGLGAAAAIGLAGLALVQLIPPLDIAVDGSLMVGLAAVGIGVTLYEGVDWAAHHWSTVEHVAGTVASDAVHVGEAVAGAEIHAVTDVAHVGSEVVGTALHDAGSVVHDLNPFSW